MSLNATGRECQDTNSSYGASYIGSYINQEFHGLGFFDQEATNKPMITIHNVKYQLQLCNGRLYNSRAVNQAGESYLADYIVPTGKFGGGGTVVWGYISWFGQNSFPVSA